MLPASNQGLGFNIGFPDVCNTPAPSGTVPIPYPNLGANATSMPMTPTIMVSMVPGHNQTAKPLLTNGDNAGVAHSSFMQSGGNNLGNIKVLMSGSPAETLANPTQGNNYNCSTDAKLVPSITTVLMTFRRPTPAADLAVLFDDPRLAPAVAADCDADGVLTLRVRRFSAAAPALVRRALQAHPQARALVFDLRGCPGGLLASAADLAGLLLEDGREVVCAQFADGRAKRFLATGGRLTLPTVIRVDGGTASAAEVFAATLQEAGRAVVAGAPTFGKLEADAVFGAARGLSLSVNGATLGRVAPQAFDLSPLQLGGAA